jgi:hypothetical protein
MKPAVENAGFEEEGEKKKPAHGKVSGPPRLGVHSPGPVTDTCDEEEDGTPEHDDTSRQR